MEAYSPKLLGAPASPCVGNQSVTGSSFGNQPCHLPTARHTPASWVNQIHWFRRASTLNARHACMRLGWRLQQRRQTGDYTSHLRTDHQLFMHPPHWQCSQGWS